MTMTFSRVAMLLVAGLSFSAASTAKDKKPVDPNKKVCRSEVPTGSMMRKSVCHTVAEWSQIDAANAASARHIQDQSTRTGAQQ